MAIVQHAKLIDSENTHYRRLLAVGRPRPRPLVQAKEHALWTGHHIADS
jgi:hypothetical protein